MWFVTRVNITAQGVQGNSIQKYDNETSAYKR